MDNVTHTLVGLMLSRVGFNRGEKGAAVAIMLAANAPDVDGYAFFTDNLTYLEVHRGYLHSFAFMPLVALVPLLLVKLATRTRVTLTTLVTYVGCLVAVLSHLLLDWTNVYGVRLMLPFNANWYRLDITNLIDPVILGLLLAALAIPILAAMVSSQIAGKKSAGPKRGWAWFALVMLLGYEVGRWSAHERAIGTIAAFTYKGAPARRISVFPESLFRWRGVVEGDGFIYELPVDLSGEFDAAGGQTEYPSISSPAIDAARTTRTFKVFENFNQLPFWTLLPVDDTLRVELIDLRFGTVHRPGFEAVAFVEPDGRIARTYVSFGVPVGSNGPVGPNGPR
jgi:inner membrane protein